MTCTAISLESTVSPFLKAMAKRLESFDQRVYAAVALIPRGRLATYGQIADLIGTYGCARQVGWALRRLPLPSAVPWQRVVNAQGRISFSPSREGSDWIQAELLRAEGIAVDGEGRLPLGRYLWVPPLEFVLDG
jgi:methylated-DNA-protein-cysteine methyltransferase related protein